jgi:hypothetical protein
MKISSSHPYRVPSQVSPNEVLYKYFCFVLFCFVLISTIFAHSSSYWRHTSENSTHKYMHNNFLLHHSMLQIATYVTITSLIQTKPFKNMAMCIVQLHLPRGHFPKTTERIIEEESHSIRLQWYLFRSTMFYSPTLHWLPQEVLVICNE